MGGILPGLWQKSLGGSRRHHLLLRQPFARPPVPVGSNEPGAGTRNDLSPILLVVHGERDICELSQRETEQIKKLASNLFDGQPWIEIENFQLSASVDVMATLHLPYRLDGKVALVTGSGRGIGASIATELGRCGAKVVVNYANAAESAAAVVNEIVRLGSDAIAFKADVRHVAQTTKLMDDAIAHFGQLDIVVSNSGVVSFGHLNDVTEVYFIVYL